MSDEYEHVSRGKLKLKSDSEIKKKKKKKSKDKEKLREKVEKALVEESHGSGSSGISEQGRSQGAPPGRVLTKAEESFKKMQEKMVRLCDLK